MSIAIAALRPMPTRAAEPVRRKPSQRNPEPKPAPKSNEPGVRDAARLRDAAPGRRELPGAGRTVPPTAPARTTATTEGAATGTRRIVEILASDSGYENRIVASSDGFRSWRELGIDNQGLGRSITLDDDGPVEFGIINGEGVLLRAGKASSNADGIEHARVLARTADSETLGFEDLVGGGDRDFNDAIIRITTERAPTPTLDPAPPTQPAKDTGPVGGVDASAGGRSRSGLGDGTNPGRGTGRTRSPNDGTLNPAAGGTGAPSRAERGGSGARQTVQHLVEQAATERRRLLLESTYRPASRKGASALT